MKPLNHNEEDQPRVVARCPKCDRAVSRTGDGWECTTCGWRIGGSEKIAGGRTAVAGSQIPLRGGKSILARVAPVTSVTAKVADFWCGAFARQFRAFATHFHGGAILWGRLLKIRFFKVGVHLPDGEVAT
jgi:hypothetical protein